MNTTATAAGNNDQAPKPARKKRPRKKAPAKRGRPAGSTNRQADQHLICPPQCRACGVPITAGSCPTKDSRTGGWIMLQGRRFRKHQRQMRLCKCGQWNLVLIGTDEVDA